MNAKRMTEISAHVEQESMMFNYLTVEETLQLAAKFHLGPEQTETDIDRAVSDVMTELGLQKIAKSRVGGAQKRGIR